MLDVMSDLNPSCVLCRTYGAHDGTCPADFFVTDKGVFDVNKTREGHTRDVIPPREDKR